jgi:hypothetical protein
MLVKIELTTPRQGEAGTTNRTYPLMSLSDEVVAVAGSKKRAVTRSRE